VNHQGDTLFVNIQLYLIGELEVVNWVAKSNKFVTSSKLFQR